MINPNCYHLDGPTGVKYATARIKKALVEENPQYALRFDIKSYYASIPHFKLLQDINKYYHDPKVILMLNNIITNPIDTARGIKNSSCGIAVIPHHKKNELNLIIYKKYLDTGSRI